MPTLDIFSSDAFSLTSLTDTINNIPFKPGRIGQLGWFNERGISTRAIMIESKSGALRLIPAGPFGGTPGATTAQKASMISIPTVHLPDRASIYADEVQGIRAFGSETETKTVQGVVRERLEDMRSNLDVTLEYQRIGAVKGQVLDADGTTVLLDMFTAFNVSQNTLGMALTTTTTKVRLKVVEAKRLIEAELMGLQYSSLRALCGPGFFDALVGHGNVEESFDRWMSGEFLREDVRLGFYFAGVFWEEYRGAVIGSGGTAIDFIGADDAYLVPEGVRGLLLTKFGPADYVETVNTIGIPYYAKQELKPMGKGIDIEAQSNPISICTRPRAIVKLTKV